MVVSFIQRCIPLWSYSGKKSTTRSLSCNLPSPTSSPIAMETKDLELEYNLCFSVEVIGAHWPSNTSAPLRMISSECRHSRRSSIARI